MKKKKQNVKKLELSVDSKWLETVERKLAELEEKYVSESRKVTILEAKVRV